MLCAAITLVILAYALYTVSIFSEQKRKKIEPWMVVVFGIAISCDFSGTISMALLAGKIRLNLHSICGYSAMIIMAAHFVLSVIALIRRGEAERIFSKYSPFAWAVWSLAFLTGIPR
ncbi:MAG: hypothetical protein PHT51_03190 [Patescibacteria group bacterium]|nr:hypothetical protein [Patescibacteria group bacterium]MDD4611120.1 hypothetical protein [Patescibacteria group bacterium]